MTHRVLLISGLSGCVWATIAWILGRGMMGTALWGGLLASPLIGVAVGLIHHRLDVRSRGGRLLLALATLYLAATLFGIGVGLYDMTRNLPGRDLGGVLIQAVLATLWGLTFTGFVVFLWPLSMLNHWLLDRWTRPLANDGTART